MAKKQTQAAKKAGTGIDVPALGTALGEAFAKTVTAWRPKAVAAMKPTIARLAKGETPANGALVKLRDAINETSAAARANDAGAIAKTLATLNRPVRRLERATRK